MSGGFGNGPFSAVPYGAAGAETIVWGWEPFVGSNLTRLASMSFKVTNDAWPVRITIDLSFTTGTFERAWDGEKFSELYWRGSLCSPIKNGFLFSLRRTTGWPGQIATVDILTTDFAGVVLSGQAS